MMDVGPVRDVASECTVFKTSTLPSDERYMASVGNGYLATIVYSDTLYMNGLFNGAGNTTHRAKIPSPCNMQVSMKTCCHSNNTNETFALDVKKGIFTHQIRTADFSVCHCIYAHQLYTQLLVSEISIHRNKNCDEPITVTVTDHFKPTSPDLDISISTRKHSHSQN
ncbi:protein-glucosylgalactosylhydroxylysine glucosidase-like [Ptychodera flava]|uniref:protein-glucosylgalactosylhydroxylysine glucosidase-like n=1 Tax=Ptychodera flava TaxID=63121 RepID=UPI00396A5E04